MAVAHDADSNANSGTGAVASLTWSHTTTGSNTLLVVGLMWTGASANMTTITHAGNAATGSLTKLQTPTATSNSAIWWWVNPTSGAQNIIATPSLSSIIMGGGATFTGVDQSKPVLTFDSTAANGTNFGTITTDYGTSGWGTMIFEHMSMLNATSTITTVAPATQAYNQSDATAGRAGQGQYYLSSTKGTYPMRQTISGAVAREYVQQCITINPIGGVSVAKTNINNFEDVWVGDGMGTSEKIR